MKYFALSITLFGLLFFGTATITQAQTFDQSVTERDLQLSINPETPGSNERVTAEIDSLVVNVNRMNIIWFLDGKIVKSGVGETTLEFTTGRPGELTRIEAYIQVDSQTNLRKWIQVAPADLDVLWQADTYTPPFYRGKALPTSESFITFVGVPNMRNEGSDSQEDSVVFVWELNGDNLPDQSGYGANPLTIRSDILNSEERVRVTATHQDGYTQAEASSVVTIQEPLVVLYNTKSHLRNANQLRNVREGDDVLIAAEPYFFSIRRELVNLLDFQWSLNNRILTEEQEPDGALLPLSIQTQSASQIVVGVENPTKILQIGQSAEMRVIQ